jgi:hypothetical protein
MATHINTGEWQSFEVRMRRRRVDRLIVRAENALAHGKADEVREALDEARRLAPGVPQIAALEQALEGTAADVPLDLSSETPIDLPLEPALALDDLDEDDASTTVLPFAIVSSPAPRDRSRGLVAIAALFVIAASTGTAVWIYQTIGHDGKFFTFTQELSSPQSQRPVAAASLAPPSTTTPPASSSTRVMVETVNASTVGGRPALPPQPRANSLTPPSQPELLEVPRPTVAPTATSGATAPAPQTREFEPAPATFAERTALLPPLDIPPSNMIAEARTAVPTPSPDVRPAVKIDTPKAAEAISLAAKDDADVRGVLNRYASAYSHLDADAAQQVWPAVNHSALSRAFDGLASQHVSLDRCAVNLHGATAQAVCAGSATWSPKVGNGGTHTEARNWTFQLAKAGTDWQIVSARVQNNQNK